VTHRAVALLLPPASLKRKEMRAVVVHIVRVCIHKHIYIYMYMYIYVYEYEARVIVVRRVRVNMCLWH